MTHITFKTNDKVKTGNFFMLFVSLAQDFHQEMVFFRNVSGFLTLSSIFNLDFSHGSSLHLDLTAAATLFVMGLVHADPNCSLPPPPTERKRKLYEIVFPKHL